MDIKTINELTEDMLNDKIFIKKNNNNDFNDNILIHEDFTSNEVKSNNSENNKKTICYTHDNINFNIENFDIDQFEVIS